MRNKQVLLSGRAVTTNAANVPADRYSFLHLSDAEPNLGTAQANDYVLVYNTHANSTGNRIWSSQLILAYANANGAFAKANGAYANANGAFAAANGAYANANGAFAQSNAAYIHANSGFIQTNSAFGHANAAYQSQNATGQYANSAFIKANSAFDHANAAYLSQNATGQYANSAFFHANSAYQSQNTTGQYANAAFVRANNSLDANNGGTVTGDVRITGNLTVAGATTYVNTSSVLIADNIITLNAAINQASAPTVDAGIEVDRGNAANVYLLWNETIDKWTVTNDGTGYYGIASDAAESYANSAFVTANAAFANANGAFAKANGAYTHANSGFIQANAGFLQANAAFNTGNAAFIRANNSLDANNGGTVTGNVTIVGNLTSNTLTTTGSNGSISGANAIFTNYIFAANGTVDLLIYANNAYANANGAFAAANAAFANANGAFAKSNAAFANANGAFAAANAAYNHANSGFIQANAGFIHANSGFFQANAAFANANGAFAAANAAYNQSNSAFIHANSAYATANFKTETFVQDTAPASANVDDIWIDSTSGIQYVYINSNSSNQWVEFSAYSSPLNGTANIQFADQTIFTVNSAQDLVISNPSTANIKLISGNTIITGNLIADAPGKDAFFNNLRAVYFRVNTETIIANSAAVNIVGSTGYFTQLPTSNGYMMQITGPDNAVTRVVNDSAGVASYSAFIGRHSRGTHQNPTAAQANDLLARFSGNGYGATGYGINAGGASMDVYATENYTDTARGSKLIFSTTANGTNARTVSATIDANTATFSGTIVPQKGFVYATRTANVGNSVAVTIDFANDAFVRCTVNSNMTVNFTNFTTGKIVDLWVTNLSGTARTITHGVSATNATNNGTTESIPSTSTAKFQFYSFDGNLGNTYVAIVQG